MIYPRILIVDDEVLLRRALAVLIPWDKLGCEQTGECANGEQALVFLENNPVDIVITDIRMPVMDGLELMEKIHSYYPGIKIIVLSGHDDFPYVKTALKCGACGYVLKPVIREEIMQAILDAKARLLKEYEEARLKYEIREKERKELIRGIITGKIDVQRVHRETLDRLFAELGNDYYCVGLVRLRNAARECGQIHDLQDYLPGKSSLYEEAFLIDEQEYCILIGDNDATFNAEVCFHSIKSELEADSGCECIFGIGCICTQNDLHISYQHALEALRHNLCYDIDAIIGYEKINKLISNSISQDYPFSQEQILLHSITGTDSLAVIQAVESFFLKAFDGQLVQVDDARHILTELVVSIKRYLEGYHADPIFDSGEILKALASDIVLERIKSLLIQSLVNANLIIQKYQKNTMHPVVEHAKKIIYEHFNKKITLDDVAARVFVSKSYFCKLFKEETGLNFKNYLNDLRIEKACEMLRDSSFKNYEVACQVGFDDPSYFNQLFKRKVGLTPMEYRTRQVIPQINRPD